MKKIFYRLCVLCIVCAAENGYSGLLEKEVEAIERRVRAPYDVLDRQLCLQLSLSLEFQYKRDDDLDTLMEEKRILEVWRKKLLEKKASLQKKIMGFDRAWSLKFQNDYDGFTKCDKESRKADGFYYSVKSFHEGNIEQIAPLWRNVQKYKEGIKEKQTIILETLEESNQLSRKELEHYEGDLKEIIKDFWSCYEKVKRVENKIKFLQKGDACRQEEVSMMETDVSLGTRKKEPEEEVKMMGSFSTLFTESNQ